MQQQFVGLTMPVFTAFGWAGEEAALNFALSQLEMFVTRLHGQLSRQLQNHLPAFGLNRDSQSVYLAANQEPEEDVYIAFNARPLSLEIQVGISDEMAISRALQAANDDPERWRQLLQDLGADWQLHIKQMEIEEEDGERVSYQDLFKDSVAELDEETAASLASRANFLHGEPQWVVPLYLSRRVPAEQVAAMGSDVVHVMAAELQRLLPFLDFVMGRTRRKKAKARAKAARATVEETKPEEIDPESQFIYITELKPLHIRRGFVNLTPQHWDFFARTARSTTRNVTVAIGDRVDKESAVWRLAANDMARVVLSDSARKWFEETFEPDDRVQVTATKVSDEEIKVNLALLESP
ncbi:MAG: hypothetical protein R3272_12670 [Candidatus Promineifilaceae bacterium]|nr:hypothetical protein [Candidatus Promineifilaceae bacterium]